MQSEIPAEKLKPIYVKNRTQPVQPYSIRVLGDHTQDNDRAFDHGEPSETSSPEAAPPEESELEPVFLAEEPAAPEASEPPVEETAPPAAKTKASGRPGGRSRRQRGPEVPLPPASRPR